MIITSRSVTVATVAIPVLFQAHVTGALCARIHPFETSRAPFIRFSIVLRSTVLYCRAANYSTVSTYSTSRVAHWHASWQTCGPLISESMQSVHRLMCRHLLCQPESVFCGLLINLTLQSSQGRCRAGLSRRLHLMSQTFGSFIN